MARKVLHLSRLLESRPLLCEVAGITVRHFEASRGVDTWLELRRRAFEDQPLPVRAWSRDDFHAEFVSKPWWSPAHVWFAEATPPDAHNADAVGAVALAMRGDGESALPVIHWLMVLPEWRRRGVGRLLLATLETACWDAGHRKIGLETHAAWTAAVEFYRTMGYVQA